MSKYLRRKPLIAVKSDTFYRFQARRLQELMNVQFHIARYRPCNYGIISCLIMHLIRHVCHSPIAKKGYLRDALEAVQFSTVAKRFGMFFLQTLDLEHAAVGEIASEDDRECQEAMGQARTGKKTNKSKPIPLENGEPTEGYPLGNAPTWSEIVSTMEKNPNVLMKEWVWDPVWDGHHVASTMFVDFTVAFLSALSIEACHQKRLPEKPLTLEEAMEFWTVSSLQKVLSNTEFIASTHHLKRKFPGKENPGFCDYFDIFFPPPHQKFSEKSVWTSFLKKGYLNLYFKALDEMEDDEIEEMQCELRKHFGRVQCLPDAALSSTGRLWTVNNGSIQFLTNPIFYKIDRIGSGVKATRQTFRVKASKNIIEARLDEHHRGIPFADSKREARRSRKLKKVALARKSAKTKNKRAPPQRKKKQEEEKEETPSEESDRQTFKISKRKVKTHGSDSDEEADDEDEGDELESSEEEDGRVGMEEDFHEEDDDEGTWNDENFDDE